MKRGKKRKEIVPRLSTKIKLPKHTRTEEKETNNSKKRGNTKSIDSQQGKGEESNINNETIARYNVRTDMEEIKELILRVKEKIEESVNRKIKEIKNKIDNLNTKCKENDKELERMITKIAIVKVKEMEQRVIDKIQKVQGKKEEGSRKGGDESMSNNGN